MTAIDRLKLKRQRLTEAIHHCESAVERAEIEGRIKEIDDELAIREDQLGTDIAEALKDSTTVNAQVCPVCTGTGMEPNSFYSSHSTGQKIYCYTCNVAGIVIVPKNQKSCTWTEDEDGNWDTQCDNIFVIIEGTPTENKMKFCCYCGGRLKEVRYKEKEESEKVKTIDVDSTTRLHYTWRRKEDGQIWEEIVALECLEGHGDTPHVHCDNPLWEIVSRKIIIEESDNG